MAQDGTVAQVKRFGGEPPREVSGRRESWLNLLRALKARHHRSLEILTAYDRGEVERPRARRRETKPPADDRPVHVDLTLADTIDAYRVLLDCTEARARADLRDPERLQAALARPSMYSHYRDADLALRAVALLHGISEGQPFLDGNKRTAHLVMTEFLYINGFELDLAIETDLAAWILDLSDGLTVEAFADLLRPWLLPAR